MNKKLYVGNLPPAAEEAQLLALFSADGRQVASVRILTDKETKRSRGFGFVEMLTEADAESAMDALNGHDFMGRPLSVTEAREQTPREAEVTIRRGPGRGAELRSRFGGGRGGQGDRD